MAFIVQKYGGSSVANAERINNVAQKIKRTYLDGNKVVVVVSARGDTTDDLIQMSKEISENPSPREMDMLLATGEQISIALLAMALEAINVPAISLTGPQAGIITDCFHSKAKIKNISSDRVNQELEKKQVVIVAGFQGVTSDNEITTLGRGGSDTTAVALAIALKADVCEIYTDVNGVYTTDPRVVKNAKKINVISYDEMLELASLGAVVLHPRSVELGKIYKIPIHVRSSFSQDEGTLVMEVEKMEKDIVVTGVAYDLNVVKFGVFDVQDKPGNAFKIFSALAENKINVDMIIQSAMRNNVNDIAFTSTKDDLHKVNAILDKLVEQVGASGYSYDENVAKVSIVGAGMVSSPGVAAKMFETLANGNINIEMITTSEIKVSCVIKAEEATRAVQLLHQGFNLERINS